MKLQTQFTVPNKKLKDLDYVKKVDFFEEILNKECKDYPNQDDHLNLFEYADTASEAWEIIKSSKISD